MIFRYNVTETVDSFTKNINGTETKIEKCFESKECHMKKSIILASLIGLFIGGIAVAEEDSQYGVTVNTTWVSKYIWRGIDKLDDKAAIQPSIGIDLGSGFSATVWGSWAGSSKGGGSVSTVDADEMDYILTYANSIYEGEAYATNYSVSWVYYDFTDQASKTADAQEINASIAMPNLCPYGVIPSYTIVKMWAAKSRGNAGNVSGWIHVLGLDYALTVPGFLENNPEQAIDLHWDLTYNGGAGAAGGGVDHDWSHVTLGASTDIAAGPGTFRPGVFYQISMDKSVNTENELYTGLSYSLSF